MREFLKLNKPKVIDIRDSFSYDMGHINGARNINFNSLISDYNRYLDKDEVYFIYCQKGVNSKRCVNILRKYGYNVYSIIGGYNAYLLNNND